MSAVIKSMSLNYYTKKANIEVFGDAKSDVPDNIDIYIPAPFDGIPEGFTVEMGSTAQTAEGDFAYYKSDGTWNWI